MISEFRKIEEAYCGMLCEGARIGVDGYDSLGFDAEGYDRFGKNYFGINRDGYDDEGYDILGFDRNGWSKDGWPSPKRNPSAYGLNPEGVDEWIAEQTKRLLARARSVLMQRKSIGTHKEGKYVERSGNMKRGRDFASENGVDMEKFSGFLSNAEQDLRKWKTDERRAERAEYLASEEGQAEIKAKKEQAALKSKTEEARAKAAAYQRDYMRAKRLLCGRGAPFTIDDILWMRSNPIFRRMEAKKDAAEKKKEEERRTTLFQLKKDREEFEKELADSGIGEKKTGRRKKPVFRLFDI